MELVDGFFNSYLSAKTVSLKNLSDSIQNRRDFLSANIFVLQQFILILFLFMPKSGVF